MSTELALPVQQFVAPFGSIELRVMDLKVTDPASLEVASGLLHEIVAWRKQIKKDCRPRVDQAHALWQGLHKDLAALDEPWAELEATVKGEVNTFQAEQKRIASQRAAEEAERVRKAKAAAEAEAKKLEQAGETVTAEVVREEAQAILPMPVAPIHRAKGLQTREVWKGEVTDLQAFLVAVLEGKIPVEAVIVNQQWLNAEARKHKGEVDLPGVRAYAEQVTAVL